MLINLPLAIVSDTQCQQTLTDWCQGRVDGEILFNTLLNVGQGILR